MSDAPKKKHRHDLGQEDHGPKYAARTTRGIQALLGLWIALTVALVVYALVDATRARPSGGSLPTGDRSPPAPAGRASANFATPTSSPRAE